VIASSAVMRQITVCRPGQQPPTQLVRHGELLARMAAPNIASVTDVQGSFCKGYTSHGRCHRCGASGRGPRHAAVERRVSYSPATTASHSSTTSAPLNRMGAASLPAPAPPPPCCCTPLLGPHRCATPCCLPVPACCPPCCRCCSCHLAADRMATVAAPPTPRSLSSDCCRCCSSSARAQQQQAARTHPSAAAALCYSRPHHAKTGSCCCMLLHA
jgi:hypothetical protein